LYSVFAVSHYHRIDVTGRVAGFGPDGGIMAAPWNCIASWMTWVAVPAREARRSMSGRDGQLA
jgi:hypothetical protein